MNGDFNFIAEVLALMLGILVIDTIMLAVVVAYVIAKLVMG